MCKPASMIITKDDVLWLPQTNSHEQIIRANGLKDDTDKPNFVRIELTPPVKNRLPLYDALLKEWEYKTDQDYLPKWYVPSVDEERARKVLPLWYESHIIGQVTDANSITQTAGSDSTQRAGNGSTQTAGNGSTQKAGYNSTQRAGYNSTQKAGYNSTQTAGDGSTQTAGENSTQKAGDGSTQTAGSDSTQKAGYNSTQRAGNGSTQTAGENSVQIGYWLENFEYKTVCRVVTKKEANKPYLFKNGKWTLVK